MADTNDARDAPRARPREGEREGEATNDTRRRTTDERELTGSSLTHAKHSHNDPYKELKRRRPKGGAAGR